MYQLMYSVVESHDGARELQTDTKEPPHSLWSIHVYGLSPFWAVHANGAEEARETKQLQEQRHTHRH